MVLNGDPRKSIMPRLVLLSVIEEALGAGLDIWTNRLDTRAARWFQPRMPRPARIERPDGRYYHVTARGNDRRDIFRADAGRFHFLELLGELGERFGTRVGWRAGLCRG
jgi:hypothetical protein